MQQLQGTIKGGLKRNSKPKTQTKGDSVCLILK